MDDRVELLLLNERVQTVIRDFQLEYDRIKQVRISFQTLTLTLNILVSSISFLTFSHTFTPYSHP